MTDPEIIIIGAGAAGLIAGRELAKSGKKVLILEASRRSGGRIYTVKDPASDLCVELGAEFIHGNLPLTLSLLKEAGIKYTPVAGIPYRIVNGKIEKGYPDTGNTEFEQKLKELKEDLSIEEFLCRYFSEDKYQALRDSIRTFVEGYDAADPAKASSFALREEWMGNEDEQYRVEGGYGKLIEFLEKEFKALGGQIHFSSAVSTVNWNENNAVVSSGKDNYTSSKVLVTVPAGVLQSGGLNFNPSIAGKLLILEQTGFGQVVKIVLHFREAFWNSKAENMGFFFSDAKIPTWWTQNPHPQPILTGWIGGAEAQKMIQATSEEILHFALDSLSSIFQLPVDHLKESLLSANFHNWSSDKGCVFIYNG